MDEFYRRIDNGSWTLTVEEYAGLPGAEGASFFAFSYQACSDSSRPVLFAFNGGPGSSSSMLHFGLYGPVIASDDAAMENPDWLLDVADIVLVDPPGTGWARLSEPYGALNTDAGDAAAFAAFVREWLHRHRREDSEIYISGESFGATRASLAASMLTGANLRGIIYIGPGYSSNWEPPRTLKDLVPAAAAAHYHGRAGAGLSLGEWVAQARKFLYGEYLSALYQGDFLSGGERESVVKELERLTAIPAGYYLEHGLALSREDFCHELLASDSLELGWFDTRVIQPLGTDGEAFLNSYGPVNRSCALAYFDSLGIDVGREYAFDNDSLNTSWRYGSVPTMADSLAGAMASRPELRAFFATGFYDIVATVENTRFSVAHSGVDLSRVTLMEYASGHMIYTDVSCRKQLCSDIRSFLRGEI